MEFAFLQDYTGSFTDDTDSLIKTTDEKKMAGVMDRALKFLQVDYKSYRYTLKGTVTLLHVVEVLILRVLELRDDLTLHDEDEMQDSYFYALKSIVENIWV